MFEVQVNSGTVDSIAVHGRAWYITFTNGKREEYGDPNDILTALTKELGDPKKARKFLNQLQSKSWLHGLQERDKERGYNRFGNSHEIYRRQSMNRIKLAKQILVLAKELMSMEFSTEEEKKKYEQEHDVQPSTKLTVNKTDGKSEKQHPVKHMDIELQKPGQTRQKQERSGFAFHHLSDDEIAQHLNHVNKKKNESGQAIADLIVKHGVDRGNDIRDVKGLRNHLSKMADPDETKSLNEFHEANKDLADLNAHEHMQKQYGKYSQNIGEAMAYRQRHPGTKSVT